MRIFVVVAKNRPELYEYFRSGFAGVDNVEVILDRRLGQEPPAPEATLEPSDRRVPLDVYGQLQLRGFVIVRVPIG